MSTSTCSNGITAQPQPRPAIGREASIDHANPSSVVTGSRLSQPATDNINSGFTVSSQLPQPSAKCVDANHLQGSNQGDHLIPARHGVTATLDGIAASGRGPRNQMPGQQNSKYSNENSKVSASTETPDVGD